MDLSKKNLCPRLVDYVVIAGNRKPYASQNISRPQMLRRYPVDDHKDFPLPFEIGYFCQPEGNFTFRPKTSSDIRRTSSFTFSLTDKDSAKIRHGICFNFFRPARRSTAKRRDGNAAESSRFTLTSICILTHHPFLSTFRECLNILHTLIDSCDLRASSLGYRGQVWELLAGQIAIENIHPAVLNEVREVETWILRFLCCPVPVPGKTLVEVELLPLNGAPVARFGFPDRTRFPLVDYPLHLPFELLGVDTGLRVLTCILLENKVLLRSKDVNAVSMTVMAFVAMLYPLEYMFPVIPLLPACLPGAEQLLLAPTPYIIGIPESFLILRGTTIPDDVWLVDLDANKMYPPSSGDDIPPLPEMEGSTLRSHIEQAIRVMNSHQDSGLNLQDQSQQQSQTVPTLQEAGGYGSDSAAVDVATRMAINRFLNAPNVLGNLTEHIRTLRLYPRPVIAFQVYSFLRSRPTRTHFIDRFAKTQAVEFFAEWSLSPNNVAFLRANTGISDPRVIGDKLKWFADQLQPVYYQVFDASSAIGEAVAYALSNEHLLHFTSSFSNGGEDSDGEYGEVPQEHSYGVDYSRADFDEATDTERLVYHMVCPDLESEGQYQWRPPDQLQLPNNLLSQSSSAQSITEMDSDDGASSRCSSPDDTASRSTAEAHSTSTGSTSERGRNSIQSVPIPTATPKTPGSKSSLMNFRFGSIGSEGSNALSEILSDKTTEQVAKLQNTMTDLAGKSKQNFQKATSLFKSLQQQSKDNILESTLPLKISITGSDAHNQSAKFVNDLTSKLKKVGNSVEKTVADTVRPQPFGPFPSGRRNPNERNTLIRHDSTQSPPESRGNLRSAFERRTAEGLSSNRGSGHSMAGSDASGLNLENQHFVKEMIDCVMAGESISWLKMNRLKKLLEDENYRNFLIARLNFNIGKQLSDDHYLSDVMVGNEQWKGYSKLLQLCVSGLDKSFQSWGLGGMGSTFQILEVAYTHYSDMKTQRTQSAASGFMNIFHQRSSTASVASENGRLKQSESFGINSDQLASGFRSVVSNVRTLASNNSNPTSILISEPTLDMTEHPHMVPVRPEPSVTLPTPEDGTSPQSSSPSSPDTEGPDSPSASRRSSQSDVPPTSAVLTDVNRKLMPEGLQQQSEDTRSQFLDPERSPFASPSSSRRSSRSTDDGANSVGSGRPRRKLISHQSITSFNTTTNLSTHGPISEHDTGSHGGGGESYSRKSSISSEFRYRNGQLFPASSVGAVSPGGASTATEEVHRVYLFESLLGKSRGKVFDQMQFWDDAFIDAVALERDLIGMDQGPSELLERYKGLAETDKKRMEHDEDRLLATMLHNLVAYMVSMQVKKADLRKTVRRLLGKSYLGMAYSSETHKLLEQLDMLNGNEIDLKPPISRQTQKQTFTVQMGTDSSGDIAFMEVRDDGLVVRSIDGLAADRVYYDNLINMTFSPKTKVLCLWHRQDKTELEDNAGSGTTNGPLPSTTATKLNQYYCKKSKELYHCIKESMERAASRGKQPMPGADLGGDFPIQDMRTGEGGLLQVTMDGVGLLFANSKYFMQLSHIRKCFTQKGGIFVLEEYNPDTQQVTQRKYKSPMSDQICYSVLCLFSYIAAASTAGRESAISTPPNRPSS